MGPAEWHQALTTAASLYPKARHPREGTSSPRRRKSITGCKRLTTTLRRQKHMASRLRGGDIFCRTSRGWRILQTFPLFAVISAKAEIHNMVQKTDNNAASAETHGPPPSRGRHILQDFAGRRVLKAYAGDRVFCRPSRCLPSFPRRRKSITGCKKLTTTPRLQKRMDSRLHGVTEYRSKPAST